MPRPNSEGRRQGRFINAIVRALREAGVTEDIAADPAHLAIAVASEGDDAPRLIDLRGAYREYCAAASPDRREVVDRHAAAFLEQESWRPPARYEDARGRLRYRVLSAGRAQRHDWEAALAGVSAGHLPVRRELAAGVVLELAYDAPRTVESLTRGRLAAWGVSADEAFAAADQNARRMAAAATVQRLSSGLLLVNPGAAYDVSSSALLLAALDELFAAVRLDGPPVAMAPHREVLVLAGGRDARALEHMARWAGQLAREPDHASATAVTRVAEGGPWVPYRPQAAEGALAEAWRSLEGAARLREYRDQFVPLCAMAAAGRLGLAPDMCVAQTMVQRAADGSIVRSACTWTAGQTSVLPRVDEVNLLDVSADLTTALRYGTVGWDDLVRVTGGRLRAMGVAPERYVTVGFPSAQELRALGLTAPVRVALEDSVRARAESIELAISRHVGRLRDAR